MNMVISNPSSKDVQRLTAKRTWYNNKENFNYTKVTLSMIIEKLNWLKMSQKC